MTKESMGITDDNTRLTLRLPESLRNELVKRARANMRSMNSEILAILENAVREDTVSEEPGIWELHTESTQVDFSGLEPEHREVLQKLVIALSKRKS